MERKEIQELTIKAIEKHIAESGPEDIYVETPLHGHRNSWTFAEALEAAKNDTELPDSCGINPVSDMELFIKYCDERGREWKELFGI